MDNRSITAVVKKIGQLKFAFGGVWSAENFPKVSKKRTMFRIINTSKSNMKGTHWILLLTVPQSYKRNSRKKSCNLRQNIIIWNSLNIPLAFFIDVYTRLQMLYNNQEYILHEISSSVQKASSNLCGLYCIYAAFLFFSKGTTTLKSKCLVSDEQFRANCASVLDDIKFMSEINLVRFFNSRLCTDYSFTLI